MTQNKHCPGVEYCNKKACIEQERCLPDQCVKKYWDNKTLKKLKPKLIIYEHLRTFLYSDCQLENHFCNKPDACRILGQCILNHPLIKSNNTYTHYLKLPLPLKNIIKTIEKINPKIKHVGERNKEKAEKIKKPQGIPFKHANRCYYCDRNLIRTGVAQTVLKPLNRTIDHIIPVSRGGYNTALNKVSCCKECNGMKGDLFLFEWIEILNRKIRFSNDVVLKATNEVRIKNIRILIEKTEPYRHELYEADYMNNLYI